MTHSENPIVMGMVVIEGHFVDDKGGEYQGKCQANGQAYHPHGKGKFISKGVAKCNFQIQVPQNTKITGRICVGSFYVRPPAESYNINNIFPVSISFSFVFQSLK